MYAYPGNKQRAESYGLNMVQVAWEDTSRSKFSSVGPSIADMTLVSNGMLMPVFRKPNYYDLTADRSIKDFNVSVGNRQGLQLTSIPLQDYLANLSQYAGAPSGVDLLTARDSQILCSSQACFLPVSQGTVNFNVRLFSYGTPVLVVVASAQGTSTQLVDGMRGATDLYFDDRGTACDFRALRLKEQRAAEGKPLEGPMSVEERNKNVLFIFQIPLKRREVYREFSPTYLAGMPAVPGCVPAAPYYSYAAYGSGMPAMAACVPESYGMPMSGVTRGMAPMAKGMDYAQVSIGDTKGPFPSLADKREILVRDTNAPIRCTLQRYYLSDRPEVSDSEMRTVAEDVNRVYQDAMDTGSLVCGASARVTEPTAPYVYQMPVAFGAQRMAAFL